MRHLASRAITDLSGRPVAQTVQARPITVDCPTCGAKAGSRCVTADGSETNGRHRARYRKAVREANWQTPERSPGTGRTCPKCGAKTRGRTWHHRPDGGVCRDDREPFVLDELPPVHLPQQRARRDGPLPDRVDKAPGPRAWGECETCGATVTGERRFCGLCLATRMSRRDR